MGHPWSTAEAGFDSIREKDFYEALRKKSGNFIGNPRKGTRSWRWHRTNRGRSSEQTAAETRSDRSRSVGEPFDPLHHGGNFEPLGSILGTEIPSRSNVSYYFFLVPQSL